MNSNINGLHQVALTASNLERSIKFYRDVLGLPLIANFDTPGLAFFDIGDVRLSVQKVDKVEATSSVIYFRVPDIDSAAGSRQKNPKKIEQEAAGVFRGEQGQIGGAGGEEWMAFFRDTQRKSDGLGKRVDLWGWGIV